MIQKILKKFGYQLVKSEEYVDALHSAGQQMSLLNERNQLRETVMRLEAEVKAFRNAKVDIGVEVGDPAPKDRAARQAYVAKVAGLYKDVVEPKLKHMIHNAHNLLEETGSNRDYDLEIKGAVYSFREIMRWGETMLNEQIANQLDTEKFTTEQNKVY